MAGARLAALQLRRMMRLRALRSCTSATAGACTTRGVGRGMSWAVAPASSDGLRAIAQIHRRDRRCYIFTEQDPFVEKHHSARRVRMISAPANLATAL